MAHATHARTYKRFPFDAPLIVGGDSGVCEGTLRNLSMQGCLMVCDRKFPPGSRVRVSVLLPDQPSALPIELGQIVWNQGHECGVEFLQLPQPARMRLNRTLRVALIKYLNARHNQESQPPGA